MTILRVLQLDLANAYRDECNEMYRYGKRRAAMGVFVAQMAAGATPPSVIAIKELRTCRNAVGDAIMSPQQIAADLASSCGYGIAACEAVKLTWTEERQKDGTWKRQASYTPFYLLQMYDPRQVYPVSKRVDYRYREIFGTETEERAPHFGGARLQCTYAWLDRDGVPDLTRPFVVESQHFHLRSDCKLRAAQTWQSTENDDLPTLRIGDFNLFQDDIDRTTIWSTLTSGGWVDATTGLTDIETGAPMFGTFYPFPHDQPPVFIARPDQPEGASRLDHAFVRNGFTPVKAQVSRVDLVANGLPALSDHLPLLVTVEFARTAA